MSYRVARRTIDIWALRLREERYAQGLTQREVAARVMVPYQRVADWESGRCQPGAAMFLLWLRALNYEMQMVPTKEFE